jgi:hypothetical protein
VQVAAFDVVEYVPAAHGVQTVSVVGVATALTDVPGAQLEAEVQLAAFDVDENVPDAHGVQIADAVAVAGLLT